jgi:hypothetical protein
MNYGTWHQVFTNKVSQYDCYMCSRAIVDCHDTLTLNRHLPTDDAYYIKLWAEIDALRERQQKLMKGNAP